ncbi:MAG: hypothetical protein K2N84_01935 [Clostridia bacterium]|nr:hypothetical protein [Clostridia bacterium]
MLQEAPKKKKDYAHPTKKQLFWRIQGECWRRAVTPYLMYLFMGMIGLLCALIKTPWLVITLVIICVLGGAAFNAHLSFNYGKMHYDAYATGELHRRNERIGIPSGGDHHVEREYRFWKGSLIGLCIGAPVILLSLIGIFADRTILGFFFIMFAAWAYLPVWFASGGLVVEGSVVNPVWCMLMALLPIIVTTVFYYVGAFLQRRKKEEQAAREAEVERIREEQKREAEERARKTEEARKARAAARALEEQQAAKNKSKKKKK